MRYRVTFTAGDSYGHEVARVEVESGSARSALREIHDAHPELRECSAAVRALKASRLLDDPEVLTLENQ